MKPIASQTFPSEHVGPVVFVAVVVVVVVLVVVVVVVTIRVGFGIAYSTVYSVRRVRRIWPFATSWP